MIINRRIHNSLTPNHLPCTIITTSIFRNTIRHIRPIQITSLMNIRQSTRRNPTLNTLNTRTIRNITSRLPMTPQLSLISSMSSHIIRFRQMKRQSRAAPQTHTSQNQLIIIRRVTNMNTTGLNRRISHTFNVKRHKHRMTITILTNITLSRHRQLNRRLTLLHLIRTMSMTNIMRTITRRLPTTPHHRHSSFQVIRTRHNQRQCQATRSMTIRRHRRTLITSTITMITNQVTRRIQRQPQPQLTLKIHKQIMLMRLSIQHSPRHRTNIIQPTSTQPIFPQRPTMRPQVNTRHSNPKYNHRTIRFNNSRNNQLSINMLRRRITRIHMIQSLILINRTLLKGSNTMTTQRQISRTNPRTTQNQTPNSSRNISTIRNRSQTRQDLRRQTNRTLSRRRITKPSITTQIRLHTFQTITSILRQIQHINTHTPSTNISQQIGMNSVNPSRQTTRHTSLNQRRIRILSLTQVNLMNNLRNNRVNMNTLRISISSHKPTTRTRPNTIQINLSLHPMFTQNRTQDFRRKRNKNSIKIEPQTQT